MADSQNRKTRAPIVADVVLAPQVTNDSPTEPPPAPDHRPPPVEYEGPRGARVSRIDLPAAPAASEIALRSAVQARLDAEAKVAALALELEQAKKRAPSVSPEFDAVAYFSRFQVIALKILLPLAAVAGAVGVTLGIYSKTAIEPKVDRTVAQQVQQETKTGTVDDRLLALEKYNRAKANWDHCMNAERDSAIERGTGHKVETSHDDVQWVEQNAPKPVPRVLWKTAPWSISKDQSSCGAEPAPPSTPTSRMQAPAQ